MLIYLITVNALGFSLMLYDKFQAKNNLWRIPEATLLGIAVIGGSLGCLCAMYIVRHKTRRPKFTIGIPLLLAAQMLIAAWVLL